MGKLSISSPNTEQHDHRKGPQRRVLKKRRLHTPEKLNPKRSHKITIWIMSGIRYQTSIFVSDRKEERQRAADNRKRVHLPTTCRSANRADAQIKRWTLSEPCELGRPSIGPRRHDSMWLTWVKVVLGPFPKRKGSRLPGRNPASIRPSHYGRHLSACNHLPFIRHPRRS